MAALLRYLLITGYLQFFLASAIELCLEPICEYWFEIRHERTMTYNGGFLKTYNAVLNGSRVILKPDRFGRPLPKDGDVTDDIITADGVRRNVITVNGTYLGPPIEVMQGSQVVVHVINKLLTQSISIHWHGIHQEKTPWMDGTAFITQCPILPRQSFTYRFIANPAGTHWYHDHLAGQRSDGLMGMLVVHKMLPILPDVSLVVSDWFHVDSLTADITNFFSVNGGAGDYMASPPERDYSHDVVEVAPYKYVSGLINGRGRFGGNAMPLSTTDIKFGQTTRFRVVNSGAEFYYEISVDQHQLQIIAVDGQDIESVTTDSFIIGTGERVDFLLAANQTIENYWLRCRTLKAGSSPRLFKSDIDTLYGIIRYDGAPDQEPTSFPESCQTDQCLVFNCPFAGFPEAAKKTCVQPGDVKSTIPQRELDEKYGLTDDNYEEYFFNFGFTFASNINGIGFVEPHLPFSDKNYEKGMLLCETNCKKIDVGCSCTHKIDIPFNKTIQMVFSNYRPVPEGQFTIHAHHAIHLHGHNFAVIHTGFPTYNSTTGQVIKEDTGVTCDTSICRKPRWNEPHPKFNLDHPQVKDTVIVPARGYVVLRFRSTNPGHWFLHCHVESHANTGMALVIREAVEYIPDPPVNFPRCSPFDWSENQFSNYVNPPARSNPYTTRIPPIKTTSSSQPKKNDAEGFTSTTPALDGLVQLTRQNFIGLIIGCIAFGAALMFIPFVIMLCLKSKN